jgi:hypothetical protein
MERLPKSDEVAPMSKIDLDKIKAKAQVLEKQVRQNLKPAIKHAHKVANRTRSRMGLPPTEYQLSIEATGGAPSHRVTIGDAKGKKKADKEVDAVDGDDPAQLRADAEAWVAEVGGRFVWRN